MLAAKAEYIVCAIGNWLSVLQKLCAVIVSGIR
jgi:hypothetical protein